MLKSRKEADKWAAILKRNMRFYQKHKDLPREARLQLALEQGLISPQTLEKLNAVHRRLRLVADNDG